MEDLRDETYRQYLYRKMGYWAVIGSILGFCLFALGYIGHTIYTFFL